MAHPFRRGWKYFMAMLSGRLDERADPKIQIQQALEEAQNNHQALTQQAAAVIGNQRQLEMKLARQLSEVEKLQSSARQALTMADTARTAGDEQKAQEYEQSAQMFAGRLVSSEASMEDLKQLHDQALNAAGQAKKAVEQNAMRVQQQMAERSKLLTQLESARMQEQVAENLSSMSELAAPKDVPSLDEVREKIERRYATALGKSELAGSSVSGRMAEVEAAAVDMAGSARLEQIRASLRGDQLSPAPAESTPPNATPPTATPPTATPPTSTGAATPSAEAEQA